MFILIGQLEFHLIFITFLQTSLCPFGPDLPFSQLLMQSYLCNKEIRVIINTVNKPPEPLKLH